MTKESLQKLLSIALFLWGCASAFATQPPSGRFVYVAPQTTITGFESLHFSDTSNESVSQFVENAPKAIIYISADAVFTAPEEVLIQAVVIHKSKIEVPKRKIVALSKTKKSVALQKKATCKLEIPIPFGNVPNQNQRQFYKQRTGSVNNFEDDDVFDAKVVSTLSFYFLSSIQQHRKITFSEVAFLSLSATLEAHITRPPPFC